MVYRQSRDAVDVNGDGNRDEVIMKISGGGNDSNVPISVLEMQVDFHHLP